MNNTMKKSTALLVAGGLAVGTLTAAELTTTEKGKEIIAKLEDGKIKNLGKQTSKTTAKFNDRVKGVFIATKEKLFKEENKEKEDEPKLDYVPDGGDGDSVIVETPVANYKLSKADYDLYDKLTREIENSKQFSDKDEEIIDFYILNALASPNGKTGVFVKLSSKDAEKKRALSEVYKQLRQKMKEKESEYYGENTEEKTIEDFGNSAEYLDYLKKQREKSQQQMANATKDAKKIDIGDQQAINWDEADWEGSDESLKEADKDLEDSQNRVKKKKENLTATKERVENKKNKNAELEKGNAELERGNAERRKKIAELEGKKGE